jgi:hypothetical protein
MNEHVIMYRRDLLDEAMVELAHADREGRGNSGWEYTVELRAENWHLEIMREG